MASQIIAHPPEPFDPASDDINSWLSKYKVFLNISNIQQANQSLFLLNSLSANVYRSLAAFVQPDDVKKLSLDTLIAQLKAMYGIKTLLFAKRYHFFYLKQGSQSFVEFANTVKEKAAFGALGDFCKLALALVFTTGINDAEVCAKFLEIENCTLD